MIISLLMKKVMKKKSKTSTPRRTVKKSSKKNNFVYTIKNNKLLQVGIAVVALLLVAILISNIVDPTGNVITGNAFVDVNKNGCDDVTHLTAANVACDDTKKSTVSGKDVLNGEMPPEVLALVTWLTGDDGTHWKDLIISVLVLLIIFAGLYDILTLLSIFPSPWVHIVLAAAISVIAALADGVSGITVWMLKIMGPATTLAIIIEIAVCIGLFILLSIGNNWAARFALKRKMQVRALQSAEGADKAATAIENLAKMEKAFVKANKVK